MNKKTKGLLAGAAGAALLLGGGTFALWSDSAYVDGGTITAGNLQIVQDGETAWNDISDDRTDEGHPIDLADFRIIPKDTIQGTFGFTATLQGDNMVANLGLETAEGDGDFLDYLDVTVSIGGEEQSWTGDEIPVLFRSADNVNPDADSQSLPVLEADGSDIDVVVTVHFPDVDDRQYTTETADLQQLQLTLNQVRADAPGYDN